VEIRNKRETREKGDRAEKTNGRRDGERGRTWMMYFEPPATPPIFTGATDFLGIKYSDMIIFPYNSATY
jgi:hypothetical protein